MNTGQLILSIGAILLTARVFGWLFQRIGQPRVVGEMIAGIVLGPSLFGRFFPDTFAYVFPLLVHAWTYGFKSAGTSTFHVCGRS